MARIHILVTVLLMGALCEAEAQEPSSSHETLYRLAKDLANCAGLFDGFSSMLKDYDPQASEHNSNMGNGAEIAAGMAASGAIDPKQARQFAKNIRAAEGPRWASILLSQGVNEEVRAQLDLCEALKPIQVELVDQARRQAYGFGN